MCDNNNSVVVDDNHIYVYADIDIQVALDLGIALRQLDNELLKQTNRFSVTNPIPIVIHINSNGGSVFECLALVDQIEQLNSPTYSIIEGCCASGATLIAMACNHRRITRRSFMLIHQLSNEYTGTYMQHNDNKELLDALMEEITTFYINHSNLSKKQLLKILSNEKWLTAEAALEKGLVDRIV